MPTATEPLHLLDVNVLVALAWPNHLHHRRAQSWWRGATRWATTPFTEAALLRLSLTPAVVGREVTAAEARAVLTAIRKTPGHEFLADASSLAEPQIDLTRAVTASQVTDAHLVNLAASAGAVLVTLDTGILPMLEPIDRRYVLLVPQD